MNRLDLWVLFLGDDQETDQQHFLRVATILNMVRDANEDGRIDIGDVGDYSVRDRYLTSDGIAALGIPVPEEAQAGLDQPFRADILVIGEEHWPDGDPVENADGEMVQPTKPVSFRVNIRIHGMIELFQNALVSALDAAGVLLCAERDGVPLIGLDGEPYTRIEAMGQFA